MASVREPPNAEEPESVRILSFSNDRSAAALTGSASSFRYLVDCLVDVEPKQNLGLEEMGVHCCSTVDAKYDLDTPLGCVLKTTDTSCDKERYIVIN